MLYQSLFCQSTLLISFNNAYAQQFLKQLSILLIVDKLIIYQDM